MSAAMLEQLVVEIAFGFLGRAIIISLRADSAHIEAYPAWLK
jgi:hypothetical protein